MATKQLASAALVAALLLGVWPAGAEDWPYWRGPEQTGASRAKAPVTKWSPEGENLVWKSPYAGRTTPLILNGRFYAIGPTGEGAGLRERVFCLNADTGSLLWEYDLNVFHTDIVENRVGWTALCGDPETGNIYAHGTGGEFICFDRDGKVQWKHSLTELYGRVSGFGGRLYTPVIDEDRVIISFLNSSWGEHAKPAQRFLALDKRDGRVLWWSAPGEQPLDTTYATPVVAVIGGQRLLIAPNADGWVYAIRARTGDPVWKFRFSGRALNASPVVDGDRVYVSHSEENLHTTVMGALACINGVGSGDITETGLIWRHDGCEAGFASPAVANGRVYVVDNSANLFCFDAKDGKQHWQHNLGRVGKASPVVTADGVIYVGEQNGVFHILKDEGDKCTSLDRKEFEGPDHAIDELYGSAAISNGRVYFMTRYQSYCLGVKGATPPAVTIPPLPAETPQPGEQISRTIIVPGEVTLAPGEKVKFELRPFTNFGKAVTSPFQSQEPQWTVAGVKGKLEGDTFMAAPDASFSAGAVKVKWAGEQEAVARVRVVPKTPFKVDFEGLEVGKVPTGWLNVAGKMGVEEKDGSKTLKHLAEKPSPPFMRLRTYMTPPIAGGYTIMADMLGRPKGERFRPDMGLVNSRYELIALGSEPTLRLVTWAPIPRLQKDIPFEWKTDVWYRVKFQVKLEGDKAHLHGKIWPRDEQEPANWTIVAEDPFPNREGSPALYGYAAGTTPKSKGCEIFYDNIEVQAND